MRTGIGDKASLADTTVKVQVENLNFYYGDNHALHDINMAVPSKRVTAMIGPSGCGKSTLLRVINRMYDLYPGQRAVGRVMLEGEDLLGKGVRATTVRTRIGMVFQKPTPFPMSIWDNIAYGIKLHESLSKADLEARIEWCLTKSAIWGEVKDRLHKSALGLSGGQQQRLCIARTIAV
ncbi:MAG: ATP-binding cassette domain-containing protein, partial [Ancalomicrobiaceae bacterium]|nr:ATP-binding cassette domain-containing protein [Ancalomicrobiaceae bacterium]